jgi:hypothetical protein
MMRIERAVIVASDNAGYTVVGIARCFPGSTGDEGQKGEDAVSQQQGQQYQSAEEEVRHRVIVLLIWLRVCACVVECVYR